VIRFFRPNRHPDRIGWTRINFLKYKLSDNVLYVDFSLTRSYCETKKRKLKEKDWSGERKRTKGDVRLPFGLSREEKDVGLGEIKIIVIVVSDSGAHLSRRS
jgi:hypothetical protein